MGSNPSRFKGDENPVENVSWEDAQKFIKKLNQMEDTDEYRLPSEAEWEYTCRAGRPLELLRQELPVGVPPWVRPGKRYGNVGFRLLRDL